MIFLQHLKLMFISLVALAPMIAFPCTLAQDCHRTPQDCDAKQVLSDFTLFNDMDSTDPDPPVWCDRYERTWLSEDSSKAQYNLVYTMVGDTTPIEDTCTFEAANNTLLYMTCREYAFGATYHFKLDYINGAHCFLGHSNITQESDTEYYYLCGNPDSDILEYEKCLDRMHDYSGGRVTSMRDAQKCINVPPKPH